MHSPDHLVSPLKVFFSYSHKDELLKDELERHLSALRRTGQIEEWHDRRIGAGEEWRGAIDSNLEAADIVLLLISADFIASDYCMDVEMARAMERHKAGDARVIPIILRPVDFKGLPFAELQALPTDASPVTGEKWQTTDAAFRAVAVGIRKAVEEIQQTWLRTLRETHQVESVVLDRVLDASIAGEIPQGESRDVCVMVRLTTSEGLSYILQRESDRAVNQRIYTSTIRDVQSTSFDFEVPVTSNGHLRMPDVFIRVLAPDCHPAEQSKRILLPKLEDTNPYLFFVRADREGLHLINVELVANDYSIVEQTLKTTAVEHQGPKGGSDAALEIVLARVPLRVMCVAKSASAGA